MTDQNGPLKQLLSTYVAWRQGEGDDGKTFLLGTRDAVPVFCVAAGLGGDDARRHFVRLGRYLLQNRFRCDEFSVIWPADLADRALYVIDIARGGQRLRWLLEDNRVFDQQPEAGGLLDDLLEPAGPLPALLRRDLDSLFEAFRLPLDPDR